ncbi:aspartyl-phosphate phosphatase Spo0E family protein [Peribacillus frigoritolerans]|nr:aspartyl-phosphate phosphatase Spo0E family protein [Peribacillus frigoritolerans]
MDDQGRLLIYFSKKILLRGFDSRFLLLFLTTSMKKEIDNDMDGYFDARKLNYREKAQLLNIVELHGLNHLKTIQCSQELDHLLNLHERIKYGSM